MADYIKLSHSVVQSENADYSKPQFVSRIDDDTFTAAQVLGGRMTAVTSSGTTLTTSHCATEGLGFTLHNNDDTNYVTVAYTDYNTDTAVSLTVDAGKTIRIANFKASANITVTANTAACEIDLYAYANNA